MGIARALRDNAILAEYLEGRMIIVHYGVTSRPEDTAMMI